MSEMKAYKIVDDNREMVEYRIEVRVSRFEDAYRHVPDKFIAGYMANELRELVNRSTLSEHVEEVCKRDFPKSVCPKCLREVG